MWCGGRGRPGQGSAGAATACDAQATQVARCMPCAGTRPTAMLLLTARQAMAASGTPSLEAKIQKAEKKIEEAEGALKKLEEGRSEDE